MFIDAFSKEGFRLSCQYFVMGTSFIKVCCMFQRIQSSNRSGRYYKYFFFSRLKLKAYHFYFFAGELEKLRLIAREVRQISKFNSIPYVSFVQGYNLGFIDAESKTE